MDLSLSYHTGAPLCKHPCIPGLGYNWHLQHIWTPHWTKPLSLLNLGTEQLDTLGCAHTTVHVRAPADENAAVHDAEPWHACRRL